MGQEERVSKSFLTQGTPVNPLEFGLVFPNALTLQLWLTETVAKIPGKVIAVITFKYDGLTILMEIQMYGHRVLNL